MKEKLHVLDGEKVLWAFKRYGLDFMYMDVGMYHSGETTCLEKHELGSL